jgi:hypothetical protein
LYKLQNLEGTINMQTREQADRSELKIRLNGFVKENVTSIKMSVSVVGLSYDTRTEKEIVTHNFEFQLGITKMRAIHSTS